MTKTQAAMAGIARIKKSITRPIAIRSNTGKKIILRNIVHLWFLTSLFADLRAFNGVISGSVTIYRAITEDDIK